LELYPSDQVSTKHGALPRHADEVLTLRQYSHALEAQRKRAAIPLDELLGGSG
jgi:hypothetical protein